MVRKASHFLSVCWLAHAAGLRMGTWRPGGVRHPVPTLARAAPDGAPYGVPDGASDRNWMSDAAGVPLRGGSASSSSSEEEATAPAAAPPPAAVRAGLAGFSVDAARGFVAVLVGADGTRATTALVSPRDRDRVESLEALCLVQLAGGIDIGGALFPPNALLRAVRDEAADDAERAALDSLGAAELTLVEVECHDVTVGRRPTMGWNSSTLPCGRV